MHVKKNFDRGVFQQRLSLHAPLNVCIDNYIHLVWRHKCKILFMCDNDRDVILQS